MFAFFAMDLKELQSASDTERLQTARFYISNAVKQQPWKNRVPNPRTGKNAANKADISATAAAGNFPFAGTVAADLISARIV